MTIRIFLAAVLLMGTTVAQGADFCRIATFNIEHLGKRTPGQQPIALAEHFDLSGADIIALQEIYVNATGMDDTATPFDESKRNEQLDIAFAILNKEGDTDWKYEIFPNRTSGDTSQLCAVAWNAKRVGREGAAFAIPIDHPDESKLWDRRPHAVKFSTGSGKTDFVLIPVHMKSNFDSAALGRATRKKEADSLCKQLPKISTHFGGENDIIIAGDTNILDADEDTALAFKAAGLRDTNSLDVPTYIGSNQGAPFDRFYLSDSAEFVFARQYVLQAAESVAHDEFLSDHQLAIISFRIKTDDDM
jgi:exonuclease III